MSEETMQAKAPAAPVARSRRDFLRGAAVGLAVASALAACKAEETGKTAAAAAPAAAPASATHADSDHSGGPMGMFGMVTALVVK
jgi:hypothetical protein